MQSQDLPAGCEKCLISGLPCNKFMDSFFPDPFQLTPRILSVLRRISEAEGVGGYDYEKYWLFEDQYSFTHPKDNTPYSRMMRHPGLLRTDLKVMIRRLQTQCNRQFDNESGLTEEILLYCIHRSRMRRLRESVKNELDNPEVLDPFGLPPLRGSRNIFGPSVCRRDHTRGFHTGYPMERRFAEDFDPVNDYDDQLCNLELDTWATNNSVRSMPREDWDTVKTQFDDISFKSKAIGSIRAGHFWDYDEDVRTQDLVLRHALAFSEKSRDDKLRVLSDDLMFLREVVALHPCGRRQARDVSGPNSDDKDLGVPGSDGLEGDNQEPGDVDLEAVEHSQTDEVGCEAGGGNECEGFFGDEFLYHMAHSYDE